MPWARYELKVGNSKRGPFDSLFGGVDDFCLLNCELTLVDDVPAVVVGIEFLNPVDEPPKAAPSRSRLKPQSVSAFASSNIDTPLKGVLWHSANRAEA